MAYAPPLRSKLRLTKPNGYTSQIVTFHRKNIDYDGLPIDRIDDSIVFIDASGPFAGQIVLQRFGFGYTGKRMFSNVPKDILDFLCRF